MPPLIPLPNADLLDSFNGLPTHPLVVHFTVALASIAAVGGVAYALVPRFRRWLSMPLLVLGVASILLGLITPATGENLEERVGKSPLLGKHTDLGDQMGTILIAYGALLIVAMLVVRFRAQRTAHQPTPTPRTDTADGATLDATPATTPTDRFGGMPGYTLRAFPGQRQLAAGLTVLVLVGGVASGIWIYRTGDSGAKSVWDGTPATGPGGSGSRR